MTAMPKVRGYPVCSACRTPYVLRFCSVIFPRFSAQWLWQRDCKHKTATPVPNTARDVPATTKKEG